MKTRNLRSLLAVMAIASVALPGVTAPAQESSTATFTNPAPATAVTAPAPQLSYGAAQVAQLAQAKVGDGTILAYIANSRNVYALNADQIIYLRQQGVSEAIITAMLTQPKPETVAAATATSAPQSTATVGAEPASTATVAPTVTYVQTAPATTYYYPATYYAPYAYPDYYWYPPVSLNFGWGWGGGWHGGHGWHH